ncbi:MAG: carboxypeptidase-like regulatory domain-containing protein [Chloroflexi bacterium]|nr:carboxypeptidase-like regulatory domain-containing protein [Chloroflexota bacterium]
MKVKRLVESIITAALSLALTQSAMSATPPTVTGPSGVSQAGSDAGSSASLYQISGRVTNNRGEPVFNTSVSAQPGGASPVKTDGQGNYALDVTDSGVYTLTASRYGYGVLPPLLNVTVTGLLTGLDVVLPPAEDAIVDGGFEMGGILDWSQASGITATVDARAAHSGHYGLQLDATIPMTTLLRAPLQTYACVSQTFWISSSLTRPTLSWVYRTVQADPGDISMVSVTGVTATINHSITLMPDGWNHTWLDLGILKGQNVQLCFVVEGAAGAKQVYVDEMSIGDSAVGARGVYLPMTRR